MTERAGSVVAGRYRLVEVAGRGGMGRVWRGLDEVLGREVAVKEVVLAPQLAEDERQALIRRATAEARTAARLSHEGIVTVHDAVEDDEVPWIVMEFVRGGSLGDAVRREGRLDRHRVAAVGARMAEALAHAHAAGVVHRDLKPDNVLLAAGGAVLTDFGISRILDATTRLTRTHTMVGTPQYMAPEQLEGGPGGPASDVWALGATLYTAVEGHPPFDGPTLTAVIAAVLTREPEAPREAGPLAPLILAALAKDPEQRPDAATLGRRLRDLAGTDDAVPAPADPTPTAPAAPAHPPTASPAPASDLTTETALVPPPVTNPPAPSATRRRALLFGAAGLAVAAAGATTAALLVPGGHHGGTDAKSTPASGAKSTATGSAADFTSYQGGVNSIAFSPDGRTLAGGCDDHAVRLWDVATRRTATLTGHTGAVKAVAFSPDGTMLATGGEDSTVRLWHVATRTAFSTLSPGNAVEHLAISPDGKTLATSGTLYPALWDLPSGAFRTLLTGDGVILDSLAFSPDGRTLASGAFDSRDYQVGLWKVTAHPGRTLDYTALLVSGKTGLVATMASVAFSPDGRTLAGGGSTLSGNGTTVWDLAGRSVVTTVTTPSGAPNAVAYSPDGKALAGGMSDGTAWLWNLPTYAVMATSKGHPGGVRSLAFSPDGKTVALASRTVRLWDVG
ncbi:WD40 repeat domain-containing serine/threonine protein kinase [Streptomyces sp. CA2R106]|uniref:WD40 repeat domain-containing serine/threonine protein kinase n=1 Tax=Streptomyces sp. CA2R106 TaxID=3120153 RepID=UPI00300B24E5